MQILAHRKNDEDVQTLQEHSDNVAKLAKDFAIEPFKPFAKVEGYLHDLGKCSKSFQQRIRGSKITCNHAYVGARKIYRDNMTNPFAYMLAYCIAGHHAGLPDGGSVCDDDTKYTLQGQLKKDYPLCYSTVRDFKYKLPSHDEISNMLIKDLCNSSDYIERYAFFTRYLYSVLVDADYIDTETYYKGGKVDRQLKGDFVGALKLLEAKLAKFTVDTEVKRARECLRKQAVSGALNGGINFLTMPTGSGKTLCSMQVALKKVIAGKKKRIIYVIPYTSIIEQTANVFRDIFKDTLPVLEHHSNYCIDNDSDLTELDANRIKKCTENWDAPFIITTNVQFFESLYHYRGNKLRKLHNLADSVIVFDEAHMLPLKYLQPCLRGISYLNKFLNCDSILLSATMPEYGLMLKQFVGGVTYTDLIKDKSVFSAFRNSDYSYIPSSDKTVIVRRAISFNSSLIIVNRRKEAVEYYNLLKQLTKSTVYHLSTNMTPIDRARVITEIKAKLNKEPIYVVSTSLIEAGVDLDFEAVFREINGLDSILQSAGRCNREGKRPKGYMHIFETNIQNSQKEEGTKINICRAMIKEYMNNLNMLTNPNVIVEYYNSLFKALKKDIDESTLPVTSYMSIPFRQYSDSFNFIDTSTYAVIIPQRGVMTKLDALRKGDKSKARELQRYSISLHERDICKLLDREIIESLDNGLYCLNERYLSLYSKDIGFDISCIETHNFE